MEFYSGIKKNKIILLDGTGDHNVKQNKPDSERQIQHVSSQMWNLGRK
jgi:hypothetical protein